MAFANKRVVEKQIRGIRFENYFEEIIIVEEKRERAILKECKGNGGTLFPEYT